MKKAYYIFVEEKEGKHFAFADSIKTEENLLAQIRRYPNLKGVFLCETATQSRQLAEQWNQDYKNNGTYMYQIEPAIK